MDKDKNKLTKEQELAIFQKVNSSERIVTNPHTNIIMGNGKPCGYFNQGVSRAKLREFKEKEKMDFEQWKIL